MPSIWGETLSEHRALVLERLTDAFADLMRERGFEGTTLAAVAERAGIARSAVYNHVKDKHDLLLVHTERVLERTGAELRRALDAERGADRKLARYVEVAFVSWATEASAGMDVMQALDEDDRVRLRRQLAPMFDLLAAVIREGVASGLFRAGSPQELAQFVAAALDGYRMRLGAGDLEPRAAAEQVSTLLLHGLTGEPPRAQST